MRVFLVNPSHVSFGIAVITPRWLYVLAAATPARFGDPVITDETLEPFDPQQVQPGDVVGIGIHTGNALRGYEVGRAARERGATVVFGGIHATLFPEEPHDSAARTRSSRATATSRGDAVLDDCVAGTPQRVYEGGRIDGEHFLPARWDLLPPGSLHVGVGADGARLPEALLVLLGLADRRPAAAAARRRRGRRGDRRAAPAGLPVHRARRRQLLSGDARPISRRRAPARDHAAAARAARRSAPSASS